MAKRVECNIEIIRKHGNGIVKWYIWVTSAGDLFSHI